MQWKIIDASLTATLNALVKAHVNLIHYAFFFLLVTLKMGTNEESQVAGGLVAEGRSWLAGWMAGLGRVEVVGRLGGWKCSWLVDLWGRYLVSGDVCLVDGTKGRLLIDLRWLVKDVFLMWRRWINFGCRLRRWAKRSERNRVMDKTGGE